MSFVDPDAFVDPDEKKFIDPDESNVLDKAWEATKHGVKKVGEGFLTGGTIGAQALLQAAAGAAIVAGQGDKVDPYFEAIKRLDQSLQENTTKNEGVGDALLSGIGQLPSYLGTAPLAIAGSGAKAGRDVIEAGGNVGDASAAQFFDTALNTAAAGAPAALGMRGVTRAITGGALGVAQANVGHGVQNVIRDNAGIERLPPMTPADNAAALIMGGATGYATKPKPGANKPAPIADPGTVNSRLSEIITQRRTDTENELFSLNAAETELVKTSTTRQLNTDETVALQEIQGRKQQVQERLDKLNNVSKPIGNDAQEPNAPDEKLPGLRSLEDIERAEQAASGQPTKISGFKVPYFNDRLALSPEGGVKWSDNGIEYWADRVDKLTQRVYGEGIQRPEDLDMLRGAQKQLDKFEAAKEVYENLIEQRKADFENSPVGKTLAYTKKLLEGVTDPAARAHIMQKQAQRYIESDKNMPETRLGDFTGKVRENLVTAIGLDNSKIKIVKLSEMPKEIAELYQMGNQTAGRIMFSPGKHTIVLNDIGNKLGETIRTKYEAAGILPSDLMSKIPFYKQKDFYSGLVLAHELGHASLFEIIRSGARDVKTMRDLLSQYEKFVADRPSIMETLPHTAIFTKHMNAASHHAEYYAHFDEFFAQQFVKQFLQSGKPLNFSRTSSSGWHQVLKNAAYSLNSLYGHLYKTIQQYVPEFRKDPATFMRNFFDDFMMDNNAVMLRTNLKDNIIREAYQGRTSLSFADAEKVYHELTWNPRTQQYKTQNVGNNLPDVGDIKLDQGAALQRMSTRDDLPWFSSHVFSNWFGRGQFSEIYKTNPIIAHVYDSIRVAEDKAYSIKQQLWYGKGDRAAWDNKKLMGLKKMTDPDSPEAVLRKASDEDLLTVWRTFESGYGQEHAKTLQDNLGKLTGEQQRIFTTLAKLFDGQLEEAQKVQGELGKKNILNRKNGWFPSVRQGDFYIELSLNTAPLYRQHFKTEREAHNFIAQFNGIKDKQGVVSSEVRTVDKTLTETQFAYDLANTIGLELDKMNSTSHVKIRGEDGKLFETIRESSEVVDNIINAMINRGGKLGRHHQHRMNLPGYKGSEIFATDKQAAESIRTAIHSSMEEYPGILRKMIVSSATGDLLDTPNGLETSHPNTYYAANLMRDMALNRVTPITEGSDKWIRNVFDTLAVKGAEQLGHKNWEPKAPVFDIAHGVASRLFYIMNLTTRPAFILGQLLTAPSSIRHILRETNVFDAMHSAGEAVHLMMKPTPEFRDAVFHVAENYNTFHPQFINDLNSIPFLGHDTFARKVFEVMTGEKPSQMADTFSRYWTFAAMFAHYQKKGMKGEDLYQAAADATDKTMVQYSRGQKAPIFQKAGIAGEMISPLQTFAQAQTGNLVADFTHWKNNHYNAKAAAPLVATFLVSTILGGAIGAPLVAEYEFIRKMLVNQWPDLDDSIPSITRLLTSEAGGRLLTYGAVSTATGYDLGSTVRSNPIVSGVIKGNQDFIDAFPALSFAKKTLGSAATLSGNMLGRAEYSLSQNESPIFGIKTDNEVRQAKMNITPGGYKGLVDDMLSNATSRTMVPDNKRGFGFVPQTKEERIASYLGTSTVDTQHTRKALFEAKSKEQRIAEQKVANTDKLVDAILGQHPERIGMYEKKLALTGMTGKEIEQTVNKVIQDRNIPEPIRYQYGTSGKMSTKKQFQFIREHELFQP